MSSSSNCENSSSVTSFQCAIKKENDGSSSQKHSDAKSRRRTEPENEAEDQHRTPNNKKARVSAMNLPPEPEPEPELVHAFEPPASFGTLDDDCLGNVLEFVGKKSYSAFGRVNKRCNEMFCSKGFPKVSYLYGYGPLHLIEQQYGRGYESKLSEGVLHFNRRDIFDLLLVDESYNGYHRLKYFCHHTIQESRLEILREVFRRVNERQLEILRDSYNVIGLCCHAAAYGKLECLKLLRENECEWDKRTWFEAERNGHEHILDYLQNNGFPTEWQD